MDKLSRLVGQRLKLADALLVTAESCTGGWVAQAVTAVAGSSEWFERGGQGVYTLGMHAIVIGYENAGHLELMIIAGRSEAEWPRRCSRA